jgi:hybrid cluster-associated redox disulfide protein
MYNVNNRFYRRNIMAITKEMVIREIIQTKPEAAEVLMAHGMGCVGCPGAQMETLEEAAAVHGMNLEHLLEALNK